MVNDCKTRHQSCGQEDFSHGEAQHQRQTVDVRAEGDTPLLWVIREQVGLTGTKYGCGVAQCGACSVHINGECSAPA